ncbi:MAG TPA: SoxR reducing system RseC family protein [Accumulibacter sp.]|nr:SoxR reducing system RseC family protein [Accumulibacter sp.]
MSETRAVVTALDGEYALVRTDSGGCGRCHEAGGCGGANISQILCGNERVWRVLNTRGARVGEQVSVRVADGAVRASATLLYVVPLTLFLAGALIGASFFAETGAIAGAVAGIAIAWYRVARQIRQRHDDPRFQPHIV